MKNSPGILLVLLLATAFGRSEASSSRVSILSPPDGFFAIHGSLEVVVAYETPGRHSVLSLKLLVNGLEVRTVRPVMVAGGGTYAFHIPITGPISLVQVILGRGRRIGDSAANAATARGAGLAEFQRLRATLEEMEGIATAIREYRRLLNDTVPDDLAVLVPGFLAEAPSHSPLGPAYEYETDGVHFRLRLPLPGQGEVVMEDAAFTVIPPGAITDREAARLVREQLTGMASALESYRIDNNVFPQRLDDVVPFYAPFVPPLDPYGNPYLAFIEPEAYRLVSRGRDRETGGVAFDADSVMETGVFLVGSSSYRGHREYMEKALKDLWFLHWAVSLGEQLPNALSEVEMFVGRGATFDLCGNPYRYEISDGFGEERIFTLAADGCDGVPQTDATESGITGFHPPRCPGHKPILFPLQPAGIFD